MNTSAILLMMATQLTVACITAYFFYRVLTSPPRPEPDSYSENDDRS
ncbi:MAG: hypothetical protein KDC00_03195 [Flavobacteriales bacterium]|nr:hypothetical protein [Flavobacteriales bacterium]MCB0788287.1 hypothetical protein [Flavobacteriales bacterium]